MELASGVQYAINVKSQPLSPPQYCQVANDTGTVGTENVSNVQVNCGAGYTVGGTVSGLVGSGLVLQIENTQVPNDPSDPQPTLAVLCPSKPTVRSLWTQFILQIRQGSPTATS